MASFWAREATPGRPRGNGGQAGSGNIRAIAPSRISNGTCQAAPWGPEAACAASSGHHQIRPRARLKRLTFPHFPSITNNVSIEERQASRLMLAARILESPVTSASTPRSRSSRIKTSSVTPCSPSSLKPWIRGATGARSTRRTWGRFLPRHSSRHSVRPPVSAIPFQTEQRQRRPPLARQTNRPRQRWHLGHLLPLGLQKQLPQSTHLSR
jgi:hypothetical protein